MARYKVIQDIEADDKLLGPLSLRQFVYAGITVFFGYLGYFAIAKGALFLLPIFIFPALISGFFAFPWGKEQSTEIWALARIRFYFKPRKRIWDQTGMKDLVKITVPKKIEHNYTDGLSQAEVKSRLQALATTIDSRGWAIKNAHMSPYMTTPVFAGNTSVSSQRLIDIDSLPQELPNTETTVYDDVLDPTHNPKAQQFDAMLTENAQEKRQQLIALLQQDVPAPSTQQPVASPAVNDQQLLNTLQAAEQQVPQYSNLPTLQPLSAQQKQVPEPPVAPVQQAVPEPPQNPAPPVTPTPDAAILNLAHSNDLNISTIAREAKKEHGEEPDEVVIPLH